ncbi:TonB-dependent receptor [Alloacidobacterium sp.]|uniref:TonB-dependent receptor n=1 Tax=Alloacidobacterium sp. TaxID=2951999 RepID=UPI002D2F9A0A|nr:TonB-dependent receptor [Alloacidobacterium sp.]HYK37867.1 TonB-dependent receptor [Alloacidobacterium sp.]
MYLRSRRECLNLIRLLLTILSALIFEPVSEAKLATIGGIIFTASSDQVETVWPNARVTLKNLDTSNEVATISNDLGTYAFTGVLHGHYQIRVTLAGFEPVIRRLTIAGNETAKLDFQLVPKGQVEAVTVNAENPGVDLTSSSGGTPALNANILKSLVQLNQDFQDALPLLPGVVRGVDGLIRIKGGRTNQTNTLVNSASVTDSFTGQPALSLPAVAIQSVQVLSNPFSSEYGNFASGVVNVDTRGGTDEWKYLFEDPVPRFRWINHRLTHGVESASPHLSFAGPLEKGKAYIFQSVGYGYDTVTVPSLPDPDNVRVVEKINSYTQLDWNPTASQRFSVVLALDPQNTDYANINTFNPQPVTGNDRERDYFLSATHRWILANGGFVQTLFSSKQLDSRIYPATLTGEMVLFPEQNYGSYFEQQNRDTQLYQWSQTLHVRPVEYGGRHLLTFGYSYSHSSYQGQVTNYPLQVLREDSTLSSVITYPGAIESQAGVSDLASFLQDNWQIHPRLTMDLGLRLDHDTLSAEAVDIAPRFGFVFTPTRDNRTAIRGGFGVFYDKIPLNVAIFDKFPAQTITDYSPSGATVVSGPATFTHVAPNALHVPYSLGWTLQFDRELRHDLLFRLGYEDRHAFREFYVSPLQLVDGSSRLLLFNSGHQSYREFLTMMRWRVNERTTVFASYVHARAYGELNDYNQFFGNYPYPLIRPNQYGPLSSDAPDRGLFWDVIGLPHKLDFVPIFDVHTGFPFTRLDQNWNFIGPENQAGRLPTFLALDTKFQYPVDFKSHGHHIQFRAGLSVYNVLNHFNPRDVQEHYASPAYGTFYNSVGRLFRIDGDFDF